MKKDHLKEVRHLAAEYNAALEDVIMLFGEMNAEFEGLMWDNQSKIQALNSARWKILRTMREDVHRMSGTLDESVKKFAGSTSFPTGQSKPEEKPKVKRKRAQPKRSSKKRGGRR